ncbi:MAG: DUF488 domain-containing protein [Proteobacteria bacterium]|nr:DUF488 domain-containing protein [Pseudomonadota bacterium]
MKRPILTIGTSNLSWSDFQHRLERHGVDVAIDVRSSPYSRHAHFCQPVFKAKLNHFGLSYLHLPDLGGLAKNDPRTYSEAAASVSVQTALELVMHISTRGQPVLCCAEQDPLHCHRCLMLAPELGRAGAKVVHILPDGRLEDHTATEARMLRKLRMPEKDLWKGKEQLLAEAYAAQERRIRKIKP